MKLMKCEMRMATVLVVSLLASGWLAVSDCSAQGNSRRERARQRMNRQDDAPKVGDEAPLFKLKSLDGESETELKAFRGEKPVVLIFGSYT